MEGRCPFHRSRFRLASLSLLVLAIVVALENHGVCFLPFFFCVQDGLDAVSFGTVGFVVWLVLHEALEELVCGFGGEEGHGFLLSSEIEKGRPDFLQIALEKIFCCGKKKKAGVESFLSIPALARHIFC